MYQIGNLHYLADNDPKFETQDEAESKAIENSLDDSAWGVWELDEDGHAELLCICYSNETFYK